MKDTCIKYGNNGMLIINYDNDDEITSQVPILYHKMLTCDKDIEYHENEYFVNLHFIDIADGSQDKISIISCDKDVVVEHVNKIEHLYLVSMHNILGLNV